MGTLSSSVYTLIKRHIFRQPVSWYRQGWKEVNIGDKLYECAEFEKMITQNMLYSTAKIMHYEPNPRLCTVTPYDAVWVPTFMKSL